MLCLRPSSDPIDWVTQVEIGTNESRVLLHEGGKHQVTVETMEAYLNTLREKPMSELIVVRSFMPLRMWKYFNDNDYQGRVVWLCSHNDFMIPCPGIVDGHMCNHHVTLSNVLEQMPTEWVGKLQEFWTRKIRRHLLLSKPGAVECPMCINPQLDQGIGYKLTSDQSKYPHNFDDVRQCITCQGIWCTRCQGIYDDSDNSHQNRTCWEVTEIKKGTDPSVVYIQSRCVKCPNCLVKIEKDGGCNRMYCIKCGIHFCFWCRWKTYSRDALYKHLKNRHQDHWTAPDKLKQDVQRNVSSDRPDYRQHHV